MVLTLLPNWDCRLCGASYSPDTHDPRQGGLDCGWTKLPPAAQRYLLPQTCNVCWGKFGKWCITKKKAVEKTCTSVTARKTADRHYRTFTQMLIAEWLACKLEAFELKKVRSDDRRFLLRRGILLDRHGLDASLEIYTDIQTAKDQGPPSPDDPFYHLTMPAYRSKYDRAIESRLRTGGAFYWSVDLDCIITEKDVTGNIHRWRKRLGLRDDVTSRRTFLDLFPGIVWWCACKTTMGGYQGSWDQKVFLSVDGSAVWMTIPSFYRPIPHAGPSA